MSTLTACLTLLACATPSTDEIVNPVSRPVASRQIAEWTFDRGTDGWRAQNQCTVSATSGSLQIKSMGEDPFFHCPVDLQDGQMVLRMKARGRTGGGGTVYWTTSESPRGEDKASHFGLNHDGEWHEYEARFVVQGRLIDLRIDPGTAPGDVEVDWIRLDHEALHPLTIDGLDTRGEVARVQVTNHRDEPVTFRIRGRRITMDGRVTRSIEVPIDTEKPLQAVSFELQVPGFPSYRRTFFVHCATASADWMIRSSQDWTLHVARDGRLARIYRDGELVAILGPLVHINGRIPVLQVVEEAGRIRFQGDGIQVELALEENEISVSIDCETECRGPVVRAVGALQQGLLAGLEYLGKGEASSTQLDLVTPEHLRFAPDPLQVTLPLMALVTDRASVAMTWTDMALQPLYATPNFFDGSDDHYMALQGKAIQATIRLGRDPLVEAIRWATNKNGLPPLPEAPRTAKAQMELC
ncbi:MAG: hypothetical protein ACC628_16580, partial [Pirellulaceae bacterium]